MKRKHIRRQTCDGVLTTEHGTRICDTAENTIERLPVGTYRLQLCKKKGKYNYRVIEVVGGRHTYMLRRNGVYNGGSAINLGERLIPGVVVRTHKVYKRVVKRLEKCLQRTNQSVWLKIEECE